MTPRERVIRALNHEETDRVPVDIGGTLDTCIHVIPLDRLRKVLGLEKRLVKVIDPMMMVGLIEEDLLAMLGGDIVGLFSPYNIFGTINDNWKSWVLPDGTEVLIAGGFNYKYGPNGEIYAYPKGNLSVPPSAKMSSNGLYFDSITRQEDLKNHKFNAKEDYADQISIFSNAECSYYERTSKKLYDESNYAIIGNFFFGGLGDLGIIPGQWIEHPKGIRDLQEWIMSYYLHPEYIKEFFEIQTEIALKNLKLYQQAVDNRIVAIAISGTDFGTQNGPFISLDCYREFYKPYHKKLNNWVHKNTNWKVFFHTCGSIIDFIEDFIEIGVDILSPVQYSAFGMDLELLKRKYGNKVVFWGAGIDTQKTLPFGTPYEIEKETKKNIRILRKGGGFICSAVHNIQAFTPIENIISFFKSINN